MSILQLSGEVISAFWEGDWKRSSGTDSLAGFASALDQVVLSLAMAPSFPECKTLALYQIQNCQFYLHCEAVIRII